MKCVGALRRIFLGISMRQRIHKIVVFYRCAQRITGFNGALQIFAKILKEKVRNLNLLIQGNYSE